jgi:hypothetical protein
MIFNFIAGLLDSVPEEQKVIVSLVVFTFLILVYSLFIWKFYQFLARREIIQMNLSQYNYSKHPGLEKFLALALYTLEYLIILPFLVLFWFAILSIFLLVLSESGNTQQILLISAAIITATRITAYISEDLAKDVAKILPFTILATFIIKIDFLNLDAVWGRLAQVPDLFYHILIFLIFIFVVEFILRGVYSIVELIGSGNEEVQ